MRSKLIDTIKKCKICGKEYKKNNGLPIHIVKIHKIETKDYYDKFLKKDNDGKCKICGKNTRFENMATGYRKFCSGKCSANSPEVLNKIKATCLKKYGVDSPHKASSVKQKKRETSLKHYGVDHPFKSKKIRRKIKATCLKKYGVDNPFKSASAKKKMKKTFLKHYGELGQKNPIIVEKKKQTYLKKYGVEHSSKSKEVENKKKKTCLKRYGFVSPLQNKFVRKKIKKTYLERFGVEHQSQSKECQEKTKQTNLKKYGCNHWAKSSQGRKFHRERIIKQIETQKLNGEPLTPVIGKNERKCLNKLQKHCKYKIKRNSGVGGFFPDGLISELKLCIEFDEKQHNYSKKAEKDKVKNQYFRSLGYNVFRIKESYWNRSENNAIKTFKRIIRRSKKEQKS